MAVTITVKGTTYTFLQHALDSMAEDDVTEGMVAFVLTNPDRYEVSRSNPKNNIAIRTITGRRDPLAVIVNEESRVIVTVYWLIRR